MDEISAEQTGLEMHTKMTNDLKLKNCVLPKDETLDFDDQKWKQWINENVIFKISVCEGVIVNQILYFF